MAKTGSVSVLTSNWDIVAGVFLGGVTAPVVASVGNQFLGPVIGKWATVGTDVLASFLALMLVGRVKPGLAVGFSAIYLIEALKLGLSTLAAK
jgi:hypothetical protein